MFIFIFVQISVFKIQCPNIGVYIECSYQCQIGQSAAPVNFCRPCFPSGQASGAGDCRLQTVQSAETILCWPQTAADRQSAARADCSEERAVCCS